MERRSQTYAVKSLVTFYRCKQTVTHVGVRSVSPARFRDGKEFEKFKRSIILPAHPWGLSVFHPADENLSFMLILQICLLQPGLLNVFFPVWDLTLKNENCCLGICPYYNSPVVFTQKGSTPECLPPSFGWKMPVLNIGHMLNTFINRHIKKKNFLISSDRRTPEPHQIFR